jgi:hypothetical protein
VPCTTRQFQVPDLDFTWNLPGVPGCYLDFTWSPPGHVGECKVLGTPIVTITSRPMDLGNSLDSHYVSPRYIWTHTKVCKDNVTT